MFSIKKCVFYIIMTDKVFKENPSKTKDEIIEIIKSMIFLIQLYKMLFQDLKRS